MAIDTDTHIRRGHPIIFGLLILFGIIELSIAAWLTSQYNKHGSSATVRDRVRYTLFATIWTVAFSAAFLVLFRFFTDSVIMSVIVHMVFFILTWIIWTAAAAAITEMLGGGLNCSLQTIFPYCGQLNALEAFAWIIWIIVTFALIVVIIRGIIAARRGDGYRGSLVA